MYYMLFTAALYGRLTALSMAINARLDWDSEHMGYNRSGFVLAYGGVYIALWNQEAWVSKRDMDTLYA